MKGKAIIKEIFSWIAVVAIGVIAALIINRFLLLNAEVVSGSMEPTVQTGERMFASRVAYWVREPARGEIVLFKENNGERTLIKRVIGLPGETVEIKDGVTYINGEALSEPYLVYSFTGSFGPYEVPEGCYFVMGDNRDSSLDARYWAQHYLTRDQILAKAGLVYLPQKGQKIRFVK